jgi:hypothetical protein
MLPVVHGVMGYDQVSFILYPLSGGDTSSYQGPYPTAAYPEFHVG